MGKQEAMAQAYRALGNEATFYDGMITCSTLPGKAICKLVWNMDAQKNNRYLELALSGIPADFSDSLLEVPVGTGVLTMPVYRQLPQARITCLDYSAAMMQKAQARAQAMQLSNVTFLQGDVSQLPIADDSFDLVLSLNGFHAFPNKKAAYKEILRVLKSGGIFCGCFYVKGQNKRTDWWIRHLYTPKGFFTPPFETADSLQKRLDYLFTEATVQTVESMACFCCRK